MTSSREAAPAGEFAPPLRAGDVHERLGKCPLVREIVTLAETDSTNEVAAQFGRSGAESGLVIFAERQTAGRGRFGRRWESSAGRGLWFSLLLRPPLPPAQWPRLTTWAAAGVAAAIEETCGLRAMIKWPNDVQLCGKKVAGILIETGAGGEHPFAVVGIGVNVNHEPGDFPPELREMATSLRAATGRQQDRAALAATILRELDHRSASLAEEFACLIDEAAKRSSIVGRWICARSGNEELKGLAESLDAEGHLLLRLADGGLHRLAAGEVTLRGTPGGASPP